MLWNIECITESKKWTDVAELSLELMPPTKEAFMYWDHEKDGTIDSREISEVLNMITTNLELPEVSKPKVETGFREMQTVLGRATEVCLECACLLTTLGHKPVSGLGKCHSSCISD